MQMPSTPLPPPPELPPKPRGSCLVYLAALFGFFMAVLLSFLMIGYFWPFVVGSALLGFIALQYLVWGWLFERIYRSGETASAASTEERD
jgi:hypothetical protein